MSYSDSEISPLKTSFSVREETQQPYMFKKTLNKTRTKGNKKKRGLQTLLLCGHQNLLSVGVSSNLATFL